MDGRIAHPTIREIVDLRVREEGVSAAGLGEHIASCDRCRGIYMAVLSLERRMAEAFPEGTLTPTCPDDWEIAALVTKEAPGEQVVRISSHLGECSACTDRASLYYQALISEGSDLPITPENWKKTALQILTDRNERAVEPAVPLVSRVREFLQWGSASLPPLPGYAAAVLAIAFLAWFAATGRESVLVIPSSEKIAYRNMDGHGVLGFMGPGEEHPATGMKLSVTGGAVLFRWNPLDNASGSLFLLEEKATRKEIFKKTGIIREEVSVPNRLIEAGKVYTWRIEGNAKDGRIFEYSGDVLPVK